MKFNEAFKSPYFRGADLTEDFVGTITKVATEIIGDKEEKRVMSFEGTEKRLILNKTNWAKAAEILNEEDDANWAGRKIRLRSERVAFKGDIVDAVRVDQADVPF